MNVEQAIECVQQRSRIRVSGAHSPGCVMAEGEVIAFTDRPTVTIEHDDGTRSNWIIDLPIEVERVTWERL